MHRRSEEDRNGHQARHKTEVDYRATLREIESLMTAEPGTPEGERLDVLATLVEAYERKSFPLDLPQNDLESAQRTRDPGGMSDQAA